MSASPLVRGPLGRAIWAVAWPVMLGQALAVLVNYADLQMLQHFVGTSASSSQTTGWTMFWMLISFANIFSVGLTAVVARRVGEGDLEAARRTAWQGIRGAVIASVAVGGLGFWFAPEIARHQRAEGPTFTYIVEYLRVLYGGAPVFFLFSALEGIYKAHGLTQYPLRAQAWALGLNLVLNPLLIVVLDLKVLGAGLATVASVALTTSLLWSRARHLDLFHRRSGGERGLIRRIVRIGTPVSIYGIAFSAIYQELFSIGRAAGGDPVVAALGHGLRMESVVWICAVGFSAAASALVGQNLGARQPERARRGAWMSVRYATYIAGTWGLVLFVMPESWFRTIIGDPATADYTRMFLQFLVPTLWFNAIEITLEGAFAGAGNSLPPMCVGIPVTALRIPLALVLSRTLGMGVPGIFLAIALTSAVRGLTLMMWFSRGRWMTAKA